MQGIDSFTRDIEWSKDKNEAIVYFVFDGDDVMCKILGHFDSAAAAIATTMVVNDDVRNVLRTAHSAYINYMAEALAPSIKPIAERINSLYAEMAKSQSVDFAPCVFSDEFKRRQS